MPESLHSVEPRLVVHQFEILSNKSSFFLCRSRIRKYSRAIRASIEKLSSAYVPSQPRPIGWFAGAHSRGRWMQFFKKLILKPWLLSDSNSGEFIAWVENVLRSIRAQLGHYEVATKERRLRSETLRRERGLTDGGIVNWLGAIVYISAFAVRCFSHLSIARSCAPKNAAAIKIGLEKPN